MKNALLLLLLAMSPAALADEPAPASVASTDSAEVLSAALHSPVALTRATAARVAMVRPVAAVLPQLRESLAHETDGVAAREEIRALALIGNDDDVAAAAAASRKWPSGVDNQLAEAIARRDANTLELYHSLLTGSRMSNHNEFFRMYLWAHPGLFPVTASRLLAWHDKAGWTGLLQAAFDSAAAMPAGPMVASLGMPDDEIRYRSVWYLARGYATEPQAMPDPLRAALLEPRAEAEPDREDFGRELLRRMLGAERKEDDRWLKFLASEDADKLLHNESQAVLQYFTDAEYRVRHNRCEVQSAECLLPAARPSGKTIPSQEVREPAFILPSPLPAGLAAAVMTDARCNDQWLGVGQVTVDAAGRVGKVDVSQIQTSSACRRAIETILRLSLATPASLKSPMIGTVLLAKARKAPFCIDEAPPREMERLLRAGGDVKAPIAKKRVEPYFPASARGLMGGSAHVLVIVEMVITPEGCVRSMRLIKQSPFPELNGAALLAISQWTFIPGYLDGNPVDVIFNLTINFRTG